jgi:glycosyltransferase involved in cell wall biosynthesis
VVIPAYNAAACLEEALRSVWEQDYRPLEVIVVDDGSADRTAELARSFQPQVRVLLRQHGGAADARNAGAAATVGSLLSFLDADDLWTPHALVRLAGVLAADPELDLVYGQVIEFRHAPDGRLFERAPVRAMLPGATLMRRESFERVGGFRTDLRVGEFIDWGARVTEMGLRSAVLSEPVLRRRIHGENTGVRQRNARADYATVVRDALKRRRERGT